MGNDAREGWSHDALRAMDTHLLLLRKAKRTVLTAGKGREEGDEEERPKRRRLCVDAEWGLDLDLFICTRRLPYGWEQFLHIRTGQVYYIDWKSCRRAYMDPRILHSIDRDQDDSSEPEVSECCTSDADNSCTVPYACRKDESEASKGGLITWPLLQEDWDLMESRGWICCDGNGDGDDQSELSTELSSPQHVLD